MIDQTLWCVTYWADFAIWSLPAKYNRLNEQNLSSLKLWRLISFYKRALLQFCSIHDTLQSTRFTPLHCQLVKFCICTEFLDTKLPEQSNFDTPEGVPTWGEKKKKYKTFWYYYYHFIIYSLDLIYLSFKAYVFVLNLVKISLFLFPY